MSLQKRLQRIPHPFHHEKIQRGIIDLEEVPLPNHADTLTSNFQPPEL